MTRVATVFLDANVLYGIRLRSIILFLALEDALVARWSDRVQDEWIENLLRNRTDLKESDVMRSRDSMNAAVPNGIVTGYDHLIDEVELPDPNDRHLVLRHSAEQRVRNQSNRPNEASCRNALRSLSVVLP